MLASEHSDIPIPLLVPRPREMELRGPIRTGSSLQEGAEHLVWFAVGPFDRHTPTVRDLARWGVTIEEARDLPGGEEAYELTIDQGPRGELLTHVRHGLRGLRHAARTRYQLYEQYAASGSMPSLTIRDWPAFAKRGVMLDVSRTRIPTMQEFVRIVGDLAALKFNHLQLYTEHTFAYADPSSSAPRGASTASTSHSPPTPCPLPLGGGSQASAREVWGPHDPITAAQLREIQELCDAHGIELAANQNCFGHLSEWLRHPAYAHLSEMGPDEVWRFMHWERRGPFSLCPTNPEAIEFVAGMLGELLPKFRSPLVNVGCDETYDVGFGRSAAFVAQRGEEIAHARGVSVEQGRELARSALYVNHLAQVCSVAFSHGKTPMFWADMALKNPQALARLARGGVSNHWPLNTPSQREGVGGGREEAARSAGARGKCASSPTPIGLVWGYEPETDFGAGLRALEDAGLSRGWVCPGTSSWRSFAGRTTESRANILRAAREGIAQGHGRPVAGGFLVCDWGDVGHMQQWPVAMARLADAAEAAWTGGGSVLVHADGHSSSQAHAHADERAVSLHVFNDHNLSAAAWLSELGDVDLDLRQHAHANYAPDPTSMGLKNASALFTDLFPPVPLAAEQQAREVRAVEASIEEWERVRERLLALDDRRRELIRGRSCSRGTQVPRVPQTVARHGRCSADMDHPDAPTAPPSPTRGRWHEDDEIAHTWNFMLFAADHAIAQRLPRSSPDRTARLLELTDRARALLTEHERLWKRTSRVGEAGAGLDASSKHLREVIEALAKRSRD